MLYPHYLKQRCTLFFSLLGTITNFALNRVHTIAAVPLTPNKVIPWEIIEFCTRTKQASYNIVGKSSIYTFILIFIDPLVIYFDFHLKLKLIFHTITWIIDEGIIMLWDPYFDALIVDLKAASLLARFRTLRLSTSYQAFHILWLLNALGVSIWSCLVAHVWIDCVVFLARWCCCSWSYWRPHNWLCSW